jgi:hypothetical protein
VGSTRRGLRSTGGAVRSSRAGDSAGHHARAGPPGAGLRSQLLGRGSRGGGRRCGSLDRVSRQSRGRAGGSRRSRLAERDERRCTALAFARVGLADADSGLPRHRTPALDAGHHALQGASPGGSVSGRAARDREYQPVGVGGRGRCHGVPSCARSVPGLSGFLSKTDRALRGRGACRRAQRLGHRTRPRDSLLVTIGHALRSWRSRSRARGRSRCRYRGLERAGPRNSPGQRCRVEPRACPGGRLAGRVALATAGS